MMQEILKGFFKEWAVEIFTAVLSVVVGVLGFKKLRVGLARGDTEIAEANANTASMQNLHTQIRMLSEQNAELAKKLNEMQTAALKESEKLYKEIHVLRETIDGLQNKCFDCPYKPRQ